MAQTRMQIYGLSHQAFVTHFELTSCISEFFLLSAKIESKLKIDNDLVLGNAVTFETIHKDGKSTFFTATLSDFSAQHVHSELHQYQLTLKPKLSRLVDSHHSRIFVNSNVRSVIQQLLTQVGYQAEQIDWRLSHPLPFEKIRVQPLEQDHQFLLRLLQQYGLFYWFECTGLNEKVVISDSNLNSPYVSRGQLKLRNSDGIERNNTAQYVGFFEFNRAVSWHLVGSQVHQSTSPPSTGTSVTKNYFEPNLNAQSTAQLSTDFELSAQTKNDVLRLTGNVPDALPGYSFSLVCNAIGQVSGDYLCIEAKHIFSAGNSEEPDSANHHCKITCIPRSNPFKLPIQPNLPKPMVFRAHVVTEQAGNDPTQVAIDSNGHYHYKPQYAEDISVVPHAIKALTRYACSGQAQATGWHFPLLPSSQVLIGCINNDPDNTFIMGFAPDQQQTSLVTSQNAEHNIMQTRTNNQLLFDDNERTPKVLLKTLNGEQHIELNSDCSAPFIQIAAQQGAMTLISADDFTIQSGNRIQMQARASAQLKSKKAVAMRTDRSTIETHSNSTQNLIGSKVEASANTHSSIKSGKHINCVIGQDCNLESVGGIVLSAPNGSQVLHGDDGITIRGLGMGTLGLYSQGASITLDTSGNIEIIASKLLTLKGKAATILDGPVEYDFESPQSPSESEEPSISDVEDNSRVSIRDI